ncbi:AraC family transcriptional regulator [Mesorhizobium sp. L-8-10]|uniref:AraC family transcriptional regulator n=1 Tax=Mesorhizobium sp. L-8-10 TaxID=2744523 RepID=UPI001925D241|nr:AraC family transcriptional regulator [Mesorhizobium sp. L-8-10]BCH32042.1 AraC family transcriptional regulator [Mesorhizobium sp. L-8-10]
MQQIAELAQIIDQWTEGDGVTPTAVPRLSMARASKITEPMHGMHQPAFCVIAQGRKQVMVGDRVYVYGPSHHLVVTVDVPVVGQVIEASPEEPYLSLKLELDTSIVAELMLAMGMSDEAARPERLCMALNPTAPELIDAVLRLARLLDSPRDIAVLAPMAEREILYRLLLGDQAALLRQIATGDSSTRQVSRAIGWIKQNFKKPFSIEAVAMEARMSTSSLHAHFKDVTGLSPLQYQKQLRLQEARRLILSQSLDAAIAGHSVGYDSPSQFSREYSRLFGAPPLKDIQRLRQSPERYAEG